MIKECVSLTEVVNFLNELLNVDYECIEKLVMTRVKCNQGMMDHHTVQVRKYPEDKFATVGIVGLLNGLFGISESGDGALHYEVDNDDGMIIRFSKTSNIS